MSELYHFGVKGMMWGVRRYQNKDGTRTAEGKKRRKSEFIERKKEERSRRKEALRRTREVHNLSDEELDRRLKRMRKERELERLEKGDHEYGEKIAKKTIAKYAAQSASIIVAAVAAKYGQQIVSEIVKHHYIQRSLF